MKQLTPEEFEALPDGPHDVWETGIPVLQYVQGWYMGAWVRILHLPDEDSIALEGRQINFRDSKIFIWRKVFE